MPSRCLRQTIRVFTTPGELPTARCRGVMIRIDKPVALVGDINAFVMSSPRNRKPLETNRAARAALRHLQ
jgi:hypothetical protein